MALIAPSTMPEYGAEPLCLYKSKDLPFPRTLQIARHPMHELHYNSGYLALFNDYDFYAQVGKTLIASIGGQAQPVRLGIALLASTWTSYSTLLISRRVHPQSRLSQRAGLVSCARRRSATNP